MTALLVGVASYVSAGILSLVLRPYRWFFSLLGWLGGVSGFTFAALTYMETGPLVERLGGWGELGIELKLDPTTLLFAALALILNFVVLIYLRNLEEGEEATFYGLLNFLLATAFSMSFSNDLFNIYVTIELMSLLSILLIGYDRKGYQIYAGIKYLLLSSLAMSLYLIGLGLVYMNGGYLGIDALIGALGRDPGFSTSLGVVLMVAGLAVKGGVLLFSMWLPDAYSYSRTIVSFILAGIATKFGLVGIIRLSAIHDVSYPLLVIGSLTGLGGAGLALIGRLPKKILAYSTISQVGLILIGAGSGAILGVTAASLHVFFHGLLKALFFLGVGHAGLGNRDLYGEGEITVPLATKVAVVVGTLSVMAIPPFSGYFSKSLLQHAVAGEWVWYLVLLIGVLTAAYYARLDSVILSGETEFDFGADDLLLLGFSVLVTLSGLASLLVLGRPDFLGLLVLEEVATSLGMLLLGVLVSLGLRNKLEVRPPSFLFDMDNSFISVFAGFLLLLAVALW